MSHRDQIERLHSNSAQLRTKAGSKRAKVPAATYAEWMESREEDLTLIARATPTEVKTANAKPEGDRRRSALAALLVENDVPMVDPSWLPREEEGAEPQIPEQQEDS